MPLFFFQASLYPRDPDLRATVDRILFFDLGCLSKSIVDYFVSNICLLGVELLCDLLITFILRTFRINKLETSLEIFSDNWSFNLFMAFGDIAIEFFKHHLFYSNEVKTV